MKEKKNKPYFLNKLYFRFTAFSYHNFSLKKYLQKEFHFIKSADIQPATVD